MIFPTLFANQFREIEKKPTATRSNKILIPIKIKMIPPTNSAFDLYLQPTVLPTFTPIADNMNVITPMKQTAGIISTL